MTDFRRFPAVLVRAFLLVAGLMFAAALSVHLATYGPDQWGPFLMNAALVQFPIVFLVFGPAVVVTSLTRIRLDRLLAGLPVYVYVVGAAVVVYIFINFFALIPQLPGQPEQNGSNYYFNNHGSLIPVSSYTYRMGLMHAARLFSGHELIFFGLAAIVAYQIDRLRRGRITIDVAPPRDDVMERTRLPYPLQRLISLQTTLTPEIIASRLLEPKPRVLWSFFDKSLGLRGEASAAGFRVEVESAQLQMVYAVGRFEANRGATSIRLLLTFKKWPLIVLAGTAILAPLVWAVMGTLVFPLPGFGLAFLLVFGVGGNFLFALDQRRRLLGLIKQATASEEARPARG
jgi:hypothetical protein